jgi:hypothetical protein
MPLSHILFKKQNPKKKNKKPKIKKRRRNMLGWPATPFGLGVVQPTPGRLSGGGRTTPLGQTLKFFF